jgi:O-glycosyl hydrolase
MRDRAAVTLIRSTLATALTIASCAVALSPAARAAGRPAAVTAITIDGRTAGPVFQGVGAISGGGGNSRLLIDYPAAQRAQILNYLFGPGGADLQLLKLEIGGDANTTDGAEPSVEHSQGQIDCTSGYEWWLARQAVNRNPQLKLYALQWAAPGWIGSRWTQADIGYVLDWLTCARSHGLTISYLGGWNENGYAKAWYERLRQALDANGFGSVQIVAADERSTGPPYNPAVAWRVAAAANADPAFKAVIAVLGAHNVCGSLTTGYRCESTAAARRSGLPLWASELGTLDANKGAPGLVRSVNNGFLQARITGFFAWPLVNAMAAGLPLQNRGLVTANQPASGYYRVNRMAWAFAQITQFTAPGWRYAGGASKRLGTSGSATSYLAPGGKDWSLVAQNTGASLRQQVRPQTIKVRLAGGLQNRVVRVWATDLVSADSRTWFTRRADIHPVHGTFRYSIPPGYAVSFSSRGGQSHRHSTSPRMVPQRLPYHAAPDQSNEAWGLDAQEGAFLYAPCAGGAGSDCIEQMAGHVPVWFRPPAGKAVPVPYAVTGAHGWSGYTVSVRVRLPATSAMAGVIGRFGAQDLNTKRFNGYELRVGGTGSWQLVRDSAGGSRHVLASGIASGVSPGAWHALALGLHGSTISARIDGRLVARVTDGAYRAGSAGIESNWTRVQFRDLSVQ